jgi:nucleoside-diphosphate-sugar epimerase
VRVLFIGGTHFVGRHAVEEAVARGHVVTVFHRGGAEPSDGYPSVEHVHGDRDGGLGILAGRSWDWVVDVCGYVPRVVRASATLGAAPRYLFVSTESVYADPLAAVVDESHPLSSIDDPTVEEVTWQTYGPLKVLCEDAVRDAYEDRALVVRPGYVVGPHDPTDRFTWWVRRAAAGGRMPAPSGPDHPFQFTHGRDLGALMMTLIERGASGAFNADGAPVALGDLLATIARTAGVALEPAWVPERELEAPGIGEDAFPMFEPGEDGRVRMDASKALANGLAHRSLEETVGDTLAWDRARGLPELQTGLSSSREAELLGRLGSAR